MTTITSGITGTSENGFYIGDGTDGYKVLYARNSETNLPGIRHNKGLNIWEVSHDGTTWQAIISGSSSSDVSISNAIFIDRYGDDDTGERNNLSKPFETFTAAIAIMETGDVLIVGPGHWFEDITIPDRVTELHIRGAGRGITTIQALTTTTILRNTDVTLTQLTICDCTIIGGTSWAIYIDGSLASGYGLDPYCPMLLEKCDIISPLETSEDCMYYKCIGLMRTEDVTTLGNLYFYEIGDMRFRNLRITGGDGYNRFDVLETLPSTYTTGNTGYYSLKMDNFSTVHQNGAVNLSFDASCQVANLNVAVVDNSSLEAWGSNIGDFYITSEDETTGDINLYNVNIKRLYADSVILQSSGSYVDYYEGTGLASFEGNGNYATNEDGYSELQTEFVGTQGLALKEPEEDGGALLGEIRPFDGTIKLSKDGGLTYAEIATVEDLAIAGSNNWVLKPSSTWSIILPDGYISTTEDYRGQLQLGSPIRFLDQTGSILFFSTATQFVSGFENLTGLDSAIAESSGRITIELADDGGGDYHINFYANYDVDGETEAVTLIGLLGHTGTFTTDSVTKDVIADNGSGLGGTIYIEDIEAGVMLIEFYKWGVVSSIQSNKIEFIGQEVTANVSAIWCGPSSKVTQISTFIPGELTDGYLLASTNNQYLHYSMPAGRVVQQTFRPVTVNSPGAEMRFVLDQVTNFISETQYTPSFTLLSVASAALISSAQDASVVTGNNRILSGDLIEVEARASFLVDLYGSVENVTCSLIIVLE